MPSAVEKITGGIGSGTFSSNDINNADNTNGSWSEFSGSGQRSSWAIERVGEWKNFTGHAIIIGRGRIESKKWNVTRDKNGTLIDVGMVHIHPSIDQTYSSEA